MYFRKNPYNKFIKMTINQVTLLDDNIKIL